MLRIPIISWNGKCAAAGEDHLGGKVLPDSYMSEYSVLGFFVDNVDETVKVLRQGGFSLEKKRGAHEVLVEGFADVRRVAEFLWSNGVHAQIADVVDGLYQG